jgi:hypothetical protein
MSGTVSFEPMSRRSRRAKPPGKSVWVGRAVVISIGLLVLGVGVGYAMLRNYLHSDRFRLFLSAEVSKAAGVRGEFGSFRWDGLAVNTAKFDAEGDGPVAAIRADALHTEVDLGGVRRGVWRLSGARVNRVEVAVDMRDRDGPADVKPSAEQQKEVERAKKRSWLPDEVEVANLRIREAAVHALIEDGEIQAHGMEVRMEAKEGKNHYHADVEGGRVKLPWEWLPEVTVDRIRLRHRDGLIVVDDARMRVWGSGLVDAAGEWDLKAKTYAFEGHASGINLENVLNDSWARRLTGNVTSTFVVQDRGAKLVAHGALQVNDGMLTALPILDSLAAYADTRRFRVLKLDEARCDWEWRDGGIVLNNLVVSSDGLIRLEGRLAIKDRQLDGRFRLGLAPGTLASIPGAETHVFLPGERGLRWAPLRITGTLDNPEEDLTDRLVDAAGARMFELLPETGERVLKFTRNVIGETPPEAVEKGVRAVEKGAELIEKTGDLIREGSGLIDGILNRGRRNGTD